MESDPAPRALRAPVADAGAGAARLSRALALLSNARVLAKSIDLEQQPLPAGWKWLCLATFMKAAMEVVNRTHEESAGFRRQVHEKWTRLCAARPDPMIYWQFIEVERDRSVLLGTLPLRRETDRRKASSWVVDGGPFDGCPAVELAVRAIQWLERYFDDLKGL